MIYSLGIVFISGRVNIRKILC